jgi:hypothetical protein
MMRVFCLISVFVFCLMADEVACRAQPSPVRIRKEIITVRDTIHGFTSEVSDLNYSTPVADYYIPYHNLETIKKIDLTLLDDSGKQSRLKKPPVEDIQIPSTVFYSCMRSKRIELPKKVSFHIRYNLECSDLLLLSGLPFSSPLPVDTFFYELRIPRELHLAYDLPYPGMLSYFRVDTVIGPKGKVYFFTVVPRIQTTENIFFMLTDRTIRKKACMVRLVITPVGFAGREKDYFGMKIQSMISASGYIPDSVRSLLDSICGQNPDVDTVIARTLGFVTKSIKYLDVEVGYGSFVPVDIGSVMRERQADCKGKSNLLCQALRSKGLDASLAMTSTVDFRCDMDFPSLSSGNHMVCVLKKGDKWIFLDPTDENCKAGRISASIQGRTLFVLGQDEWTFVKVPVEPPEFNQEEFNFDLKITGSQLSGLMRYSARGMPSGLIDEIFKVQAGQRELIEKEMVRYRVPNSLPSNPDSEGQFDSLSLGCSLIFGPSVFVTTKSVSYHSMGFLPPPMKFTKQPTDGCDIIRGSTSQIRVHAVLDAGVISEAVLFESRKFSEGPFTLDLVCRREKGLFILDYLFICDTNVVKEESLPVYSRFESFCDKAFKQVICFK